MQTDIQLWKNGLENKSEFAYNASILQFPVGKISYDVWVNSVTKNILQESNRVKKALAFIIGEKKIYPSASITALIQLLGNEPDSIANIAIFSLVAYGAPAIEPLYNTIEANRKPYVSKWNDLLYEEAKKQDDFEPDFYYSQSAMRATYSLRLMGGDSVLYYYSHHPTLKRYYKCYILDGIAITEQNCKNYFRQVRLLKPLFTDYVEGYVDDNFMFSKLYENYTRERAMNILHLVSDTLLPLFNAYIHSSSRDTPAVVSAKEILKEVDHLYPDTTNWGWYSDPWCGISFFTKMNWLSVHKDSFVLYRDTIIAVLKAKTNVSDIYNRIFVKKLLVLIANIGDAAKSLYPFLLPYTLHTDKDIQYLACKAILGIYTQSNGGFVLYPPKLLLPQPPESYINDDNRLSLYLRLSDELHEGFPLELQRKWDIMTAQRGYGSGYPFGKIYLNAAHEIIQGNIRTINLADTMPLTLITRFASHPDTRIRVFIAYMMGLSDTLPQQALYVLHELMNDSIPLVRKTACLSVSKSMAIDVNIKRFVTVCLLENYFKERLSTEEQTLYDLDMPPFVRAKGGYIAVTPVINTIPSPSLQAVIVANPPATAVKLKDVYGKLKQHLLDDGISDVSTYAYADGFALFTRMERVQEDGSIDKKNRWNCGKLKPDNISEYFCQLFLGQKGSFRGVSLIVSGTRNLQFDNKLINDADYNYLFQKGGVMLPGEIADAPATGKIIHLLIYEFVKGADGTIEFTKSQNEQTIQSHFQSLHLTSFKLQ